MQSRGEAPVIVYEVLLAVGGRSNSWAGLAFSWASAAAIVAVPTSGTEASSDWAGLLYKDTHEPNLSQSGLQSHVRKQSGLNIGPIPHRLWLAESEPPPMRPAR